MLLNINCILYIFWLVFFRAQKIDILHNNVIQKVLETIYLKGNFHQKRFCLFNQISAWFEKGTACAGYALCLFKEFISTLNRDTKDVIVTGHFSTKEFSCLHWYFLSIYMHYIVCGVRQ